MAGGWGNHIMQDEISFNILDPTLVVVATGLLTIFHPGLHFPRMANGLRRSEEDDKAPAAEAATSGESSNEAGSVEPKAAGVKQPMSEA